MLQSRSQRKNLNQENPSLPGRQSLHPTKTPLRQQAAPKPGLTGGKGLTGGPGGTNKAGRVLGRKDGNQGKSGTESLLLFNANPKASQSDASCAPAPAPAVLLSPSPTINDLPEHLRTPSPGVRKLAALSLLSPDVEQLVEMEMEEEEVEEEEVDREVEGAGASAADYDEVYEPDFALPDFKTAGFGRLLRGIAIGPTEDYEEWVQRDEEERMALRVLMDDELAPELRIDPLDDPSAPMFPLPKRVPLAPKTSNSNGRLLGSRPSSIHSSAASSTSSFRKPLPHAPASASLGRSSLTTSSSATKKPKPTSSLRNSLAPSSVVPSAATASKPNWGGSSIGPTPTAAARKSLAASVSRPQPPTSVARSRAAPLTTGNRVKNASVPSLPTLKEDRTTKTTVGHVQGTVEAERELGIFGIVETGLEVFEVDGGAVEEGFLFEL